MEVSASSGSAQQSVVGRTKWPACHLHSILCIWDAVTTCTPVTNFFPLGVQLCSNQKKKKRGTKGKQTSSNRYTTTKRTTPGLASFQGPRLGSNSCGSPGREVYEESPGRHECVMWRDLGEDMKSF